MARLVRLVPAQETTAVLGQVSDRHHRGLRKPKIHRRDRLGDDTHESVVPKFVRSFTRVIALPANTAGCTRRPRLTSPTEALGPGSAPQTFPCDIINTSPTIVVGIFIGTLLRDPPASASATPCVALEPPPETCHRRPPPRPQKASGHHLRPVTCKHPIGPRQCFDFTS